MFVGFSTRLKRMGGLRFGFGKRLNGWQLALFGIFILMFYLMWWSLLACLWLIYGIFYLCYLPFKLLIKPKQGAKIKNSVYYTPSGNVYHLKRACVGADDVRVVSLDTARNVLGMKPCGRCCKK